jgi:RHS repeat-associated protein
MEKDDEIKGAGNSYDFGARIYDPRLGRWLSLDPLAAKYPSYTPYSFVDNSPTVFVDPDGKKIWIVDPSRDKPVLYVPNATQNAEGVSDFVRETAATLDAITGSGMDDKFKIVETLSKNDQDYNISETGWDAHNASSGGEKGGNILWSPEGGVVTDEGDRQSPAEGLLHELGHKYYEEYDPTVEVAGRPDINEDPMGRIDYDDEQAKAAEGYDGPSDKWILEEVEGGNGGAKRTSHSYKEKYKAKSPTSLKGPAESKLKK